MRPLPEHLNTDLAECRRLTKVLAGMDSQLVACWNGQTQRYEVWGPSKTYGWALLSVVQKPDGTPVHPDVYPLYVLADLQMRQAPVDVKKVLHENAVRVDKAWHAAMDEAGEMAKYVAKAVCQESSGALRYGADDVFAGLRNAWGGPLA